MADHAWELGHMQTDPVTVVNQMTEAQLNRLLDRIVLVLEYLQNSLFFKDCVAYNSCVDSSPLSG